MIRKAKNQLDHKNVWEMVKDTFQLVGSSTNIFVKTLKSEGHIS